MKTAHAGKSKGMVVLPKPVARFPVVLFLYGSGGSVPASGKILRQIAELGCAAVAIEYNQTNQLLFNEQLLALNEYLKGPTWAQSNAVAWVGFSLGAQRSLSFLLTHPDVQPQLYVRVAGGLVEELKSTPDRSDPKVGRVSPLRAASYSPADGAHGVTRPTAAAAPVTPHVSRTTHHVSRLTCPVLLLHGAGDEIFPIADCQQLAEMLRTNGVQVETRIMPGQPHAFGENLHAIMRGVAEYCVQHLPRADYAATLRGCTLSAAERARFNEAMSRAGANHRTLWKAVASSREPERRTAMMLIGGLEDYDLAHISTRHLKEIVKVAWQARRAYPWCRKTPLDVFEKFTVAPRVFEEPLAQLQSDFRHRLKREVKYCRTTAEAGDAIYQWTHWRATWSSLQAPTESTPADVLARKGGDCQDLIALYIYLARSVGMAARPVTTIWPTLGSGHYWTEIWDAENGTWHGCDASAAGRPYSFNWMTNVPKAATHAPSGERGAWNAEREGRWEAYTNTVGLFYPSGSVHVRVLERETPMPNQRVNVQVWLNGGMIQLTRAITDAAGEAQFTLGQSARKPYRFVLAGEKQGDWQWLAVKAGEHYELTLHTERSKPFDPAATPPPLGFPEWINPNAPGRR